VKELQQQGVVATQPTRHAGEEIGRECILQPLFVIPDETFPSYADSSKFRNLYKTFPMRSPGRRASRGEVRTHATRTRYRPPPQPLWLRQVTAVAECAVQLSGFKNVDLFSQGVYQVRVRAYADRSGRAAVPFAITELPLPPLPGSVNSEQLLPAHRRLRAPLGSATAHHRHSKKGSLTSALGG